MSEHQCERCPGPNPYPEATFGYAIWEFRAEVHAAFMTAFQPIARTVIGHRWLLWLICTIAVVGVALSALLTTRPSAQ